MNEALFQDVVAGEGILVLERAAPERFVVSGAPPPWASLLLGGPLEQGQWVDPTEAFVFLEHFLRDAEAVWEAGDGRSLTSEPWTETLMNREEVAFSATARRVGERALLLVRGLGVDFEERCKVLRKARELALAHERLLKEISEKETLLHCLVHDVAGPTTTVANCLRMLEAETGLSEGARAMLKLAGSSAHRQQATLREMLDSFAAELTSLQQFSRDSSSAPEVLDCAHSVLRSLRYSFEIKGVSFELLLSPPTNPAWKVVGHREKLERVLFNLLNQALLQAPPGSVVTLRLEDEGTAIRISVVDQGPAHLPGGPGRWSAAAQAPEQHALGRSGLGLIFCRTMIRQWSGEIGHEVVPRGGNCLWFRLAKPVPGPGAGVEDRPEESAAG